MILNVVLEIFKKKILSSFCIFPKQQFILHFLHLSFCILLWVLWLPQRNNNDLNNVLTLQKTVYTLVKLKTSSFCQCLWSFHNEVIYIFPSLFTVYLRFCVLNVSLRFYSAGDVLRFLQCLFLLLPFCTPQFLPLLIITCSWKIGLFKISGMRTSHSVSKFLNRDKHIYKPFACS